MVIQFGFTLVPDPVSPLAANTAPKPTAPLSAVSPARKAGLRWPFKLGADGNPITVTGDDLRETRIAFVLGTRASSHVGAGEIPSRMQIGSLFHLLLNTSFTAAREGLAMIYAERALSQALPNERVVGARETVEAESGTITLELASVDRRSLDKSRLLRVPVSVVRK